jgi:hypothetical protein
MIAETDSRRSTRIEQVHERLAELRNCAANPQPKSAAG